MNRRNFLRRTAQAAVMAFALSPLGKMATAIVPDIEKVDTFTFTVPEMNSENLPLLFGDPMPSKITNYWQEIKEDGTLGEATVINEWTPESKRICPQLRQ